MLGLNHFFISAKNLSIFNCYNSTTIADVSVPDTALFRAARKLACANLKESTVNHATRSWLFAPILASIVPTFSRINPESLAIATILHDLGLDHSKFVSGDKRFEVDGAFAAKARLSDQQKAEPVVSAVSLGTPCDFGGLNTDITKTLTWNQYNAVVKLFLRLGFFEPMTDNIKGFCVEKKGLYTINGKCKLATNMFLDPNRLENCNSICLSVKLYLDRASTTNGMPTVFSISATSYLWDTIAKMSNRA
ncbi:hypothetical protein BT63DRAFT_459437 [Microthyrium microscopicum]|uniref:HD domain-containing protein n=1 Tax=Microthyrium microscopicum TaxID=703497 RepID=A0A6A6TZH9_9PEZI|nr:hypothetical protein BT63DRAFT_459437 [Microthyrium microscopicum]